MIYVGNGFDYNHLWLLLAPLFSPLSHKMSPIWYWFKLHSNEMQWISIRSSWAGEIEIEFLIQYNLAILIFLSHISVGSNNSLRVLPMRVFARILTRHLRLFLSIVLHLIRLSLPFYSLQHPMSTWRCQSVLPARVWCLYVCPKSENDSTKFAK